MGNLEKRIAALEAGQHPDEPQQIELVAGQRMSRHDANDLPTGYRRGDAITRIELIGVIPDADIISINPYGEGQ